MMSAVRERRRLPERRWYDNTFFDDGFHYKYISRLTGRMVDLQERANLYDPMRAIPKASKQIRGIANTLLQPQYIPVIYPKRVLSDNFATPQLYQMALDQAKKTAKQQGNWVAGEWDKQNMQAWMGYLVILAARTSISYLKVFPDIDEENISVAPRDSFELYHFGNFTDFYALPYVIEGVPTIISAIKANPMFDEEQLKQIRPDNKYASSEIKEAYERSRFGGGTANDHGATLILKEAFITEYIDDNNLKRIRSQKDAEQILQGKSKGDKIIRQVFVAGDIWLRDQYTKLRSYPYIPLQLEPGTLYQTPLIERFMPQNKTLDLVVSRVERYINTMVAGSWSIRKGENITPTNIAGGVFYQYENSPPTQNEIAPIPNFVFNFINVVSGFIAEQGVASLGGQQQKGVKGYQAMEAQKAAEVNNMKMMQDQLTLFVKRTCEKFLEYADDYFIKPQESVYAKGGQPEYADVVGNQAFKKMGELGLPTDHLTPLSKDLSVQISVESGLGYTPEAKKAAATQLANLVSQWVQAGWVPPQTMQILAKSILEYFDYGNTQEFMDAVNNAPPQLPQSELDQIKLAVAQVFSDIQKAQQGQQPQGQPGGGGDQPTGQPSAPPQQGGPQGPQMGPVAPRPQAQPAPAPGRIAPL